MRVVDALIFSLKVKNKLMIVYKNQQSLKIDEQNFCDALWPKMWMIFLDFFVEELINGFWSCLKLLVFRSLVFVLWVITMYVRRDMENEVFQRKNEFYTVAQYTITIFLFWFWFLADSVLRFFKKLRRK